MQHPSTSRANSNSPRATQRLGIGDVHARLNRSRNPICIVSWGEHARELGNIIAHCGLVGAAVYEDLFGAW